jgi:hypothetical protein
MAKLGYIILVGERHTPFLHSARAELYASMLLSRVDVLSLEIPNPPSDIRNEVQASVLSGLIRSADEIDIYLRERKKAKVKTNETSFDFEDGYSLTTSRFLLFEALRKDLPIEYIDHPIDHPLRKKREKFRKEEREIQRKSHALIKKDQLSESEGNKMLARRSRLVKAIDLIDYNERNKYVGERITQIAQQGKNVLHFGGMSHLEDQSNYLGLTSILSNQGFSGMVLNLMALTSSPSYLFGTNPPTIQLPSGNFFKTILTLCKAELSLKRSQEKFRNYFR